MRACRRTAAADEPFKRLSQLLRYVDGDYRDPKTFVQVRELLGRRGARCTTSPFLRASSAR